MKQSLSRIAIIVALIGFTSACALSLRSPSVSELRQHPGRYQDRTVSVSGVVTSSWGLPLVPFQFYSVDDGTGQITVIGHSGRVPSTGTRVNVRGRVQEVAAFGGQSLGLHLDEEKRKVRY